MNFNSIIDGRNQVIAACGNGSLRLFDITLEVRLETLKATKGHRAYRSKRGMSTLLRSCRWIGTIFRKIHSRPPPGIGLSKSYVWSHRDAMITPLSLQY